MSEEVHTYVPPSKKKEESGKEETVIEKRNYGGKGKKDIVR